MRIYRGLNRIKKFKSPVVALGVFDGVHIGHRQILEAAVKKAQATGGESLAVTFYPHPQKQQSLYSLSHRLKLIAQIGIDACIVINFSPAFAGMEAGDFIRNIIVKKIGASFIYVGKNFRFGRQAKGGWELLKNLSREYNYSLRLFNVIKINRLPVSSSRIRRLITGGKLAAAKKLLSRPVTVFGSVVRGISLGRKMGFPTANINPHHEILPPSGVYAVKVILNEKKINGVCNIGRKPTVLVGYQPEKHVEVYLFDFNKNIYGKDLEIRFVKKMREERKFPTLKHLSCQISKDIKKARKLLSEVT
jgi:riboflavin kinase / FMN adenylyltransferase